MKEITLKREKNTKTNNQVKPATRFSYSSRTSKVKTFWKRKELAFMQYDADFILAQKQCVLCNWNARL